MMTQQVPDSSLGALCALTKVQASKTFEYCAREAQQIFGGNSIIQTGQGAIVERLSREVRSCAIPGGSEEVAISSFFDLMNRFSLILLFAKLPQKPSAFPNFSSESLRDSKKRFFQYSLSK